jgi:hypothetical protein
MDAGREMERAKGFEPSAENPQPIEPQPSAQTANSPYTQIRAQILGPPDPDLLLVVKSWPLVAQPLKAAILCIVAAAKGHHEK